MDGKAPAEQLGHCEYILKGMESQPGKSSVIVQGWQSVRRRGLLSLSQLPSPQNCSKIMPEYSTTLFCTKRVLTTTLPYSKMRMTPETKDRFGVVKNLIPFHWPGTCCVTLGKLLTLSEPKGQINEEVFVASRSSSKLPRCVCLQHDLSPIYTSSLMIYLVFFLTVSPSCT